MEPAGQAGAPCPTTAAGGVGGQRGVPRPVLRSQLLYRRAFYLYLIASNLLLRLSWIYKLSPHLRDHHLVVFCVVLAEAFRCGELAAACGSSARAVHAVPRRLCMCMLCWAEEGYRAGRCTLLTGLVFEGAAAGWLLLPFQP